MKITLHSSPPAVTVRTDNGTTQIEMLPETAIERTMMATMEEAASKGTPVKLTKVGEDGYIFSIEAA